MLERMYIILLQLQRRTRGCICSCWLDVLPSVGLGWQAGGGWLSLTYGALSRIMEERGNVGWHTLSLSPPQYMTSLPYTHLLTWTCCPPSHGPKACPPSRVPETSNLKGQRKRELKVKHNNNICTVIGEECLYIYVNCYLSLL